MASRRTGMSCGQLRGQSRRAIFPIRTDNCTAIWTQQIFYISKKWKTKWLHRVALSPFCCQQKQQYHGHKSSVLHGLPVQPQLLPVPNYTDSWQAHIWVNNLSRAAMWSRDSKPGHLFPNPGFRFKCRQTRVLRSGLHFCRKTKMTTMYGPYTVISYHKYWPTVLEYK